MSKKIINFASRFYPILIAGLAEGIGFWPILLGRSRDKTWQNSNLDCGACQAIETNKIKKQTKVDSLSYKTISATPETINKKWVVIDATDQVLGRLCSKVAKILRGKYKPDFTPNMDCGDNVIIINAEKVILTGNKMDGHEYLGYTGYPGGQRVYTPRDLMNKSFKKTIKAGKHPLFIKVVKGMLPKGKLGAAQLRNLYVYNGSEHPHEAVNPEVIDINKLK